MFDYENSSVPKLNDDFKRKFIINIKGKDAIKVDGLIALAHDKGIKSMETEIVQFPTQENQWTCIAKTKVVGYGWNPVENKIVEVIFEDFADANPNNCTAMTKTSYIRMASTRSVGRALRKYTNIDMVCSDEIGNVTDEPAEPIIDVNALTTIKTLLNQKHLTQADFSNLMIRHFGHINYQSLTKTEGDTLIKTLQDLPEKSIENK